MNVTVFGATGGIGRLAVRRLLDEGHDGMRNIVRAIEEEKVERFICLATPWPDRSDWRAVPMFNTP